MLVAIVAGRNVKLLVFVASLWVSLSAGVAWAQITIHVAPAASPQRTWVDLKKNTDATVTLGNALAIIKEGELRNSVGTPIDSIIIKLEKGIYRLSESLYIDAASSGSAEHPVTIEGPEDSSAIISGGRAVNGFVNVTDPTILARLPKVARQYVMQASLPEHGISDYGIQMRHGFGGDSGNPTAIELTYRNQPMTLARWPNHDFARITSAPEGEQGVTFTVQDANLAAWQYEPDLLATGYWGYDWADATVPVKGIDIAAQRIVLSGAASPYGLKAGQRVFFQNALSELDQPEEWYLDRPTGKLYFWPPQALREDEVEVSILKKLLVIDNASHIRISGITFSSARGDAITVRGGHHVSISRSIIRNIGNRAVVISGRDNGLTDSLIEDVGEAGVVLAGGDRQTLTPANLYVERSTIRRFARTSHTYQPAVILSGVGNRVVGNQISDAPHAAIIFTGNDHLISFNEISNVCRETGDSGAIYTGRDWTERGTVISYNYLHDIPPNVALGRTKGVYLDDQASGVAVRGNLFEKVDEAVFIGGGRDNLVENNVFLKGNFPLHLDARGKSKEKAAYEDKQNIFYKRLQVVPYNQSPYRDRYPHLTNILEDEPGAPKYNMARSNLIIGNPQLDISKDAEQGIVIERRNELQNGVSVSGMTW